MKCVFVVAVVLASTGMIRADDWGPRRDPFDRGVIARYQALLVRDPYDPVLAQLASLYRRFRTLDALIAEYDAGDHADGGSLVIAGRLREEAKQDALPTYRRAWSLRPDDARLALEIARLERAADHGELAREAYERAAKAAPVAVQRAAIRGLLELAHARRDRVAVGLHSKALVALEPRDPKRWLEHGDAMRALDLTDAALEAYARAEALYATEPVRRAEAIERRGLALEERDRGEAEAEYRRAMASLPRDHYQRRELFGRLVELHRRGGTLGGLLAMTLVDWPVASRGAFEWQELATLYEAVGDRGHALDALEQAARRSPEPRLHLALVDAYPKERAADARRVLDRLAARAGTDVGLLISIADRYARGDHATAAMAAYDRVLRQDPAAAERMLDLLEQTLRAGKNQVAVSLVRSVSPKLRTAEANGRLGTILLEWGHLRGAVTAFTRAIAIAAPPQAPRAIDVLGNTRDDKPPPPAPVVDPVALAGYYRGRAAAHDALRELAPAVADAEQVLALATDPKARRVARKELVRIVLHAPAETGERRMFVEAWRAAFDFEPPEIEAGFLLLDYYGSAPCDHFQATRRPCEGEVARIVTRLAGLAELDPDDILLIATAYSAAQRQDEAIQILEALRRVAPQRERDIVARIAKITAWRVGLDARWRPETIVDPEHEIAARLHRRRERVVIETPLRLGLRVGYGEGLRGGGEVAAVGVMASAYLGASTYLTLRFDAAERGFHAFGGSVGVARSLVSIGRTALVLGFAERLERRWGEGMETRYGPIGLAGEATLDLVGRTLPATFGARLEQGMSDDGRSTALLLEASVELR